VRAGITDGAYGKSRRGCGESGSASARRGRFRAEGADNGQGSRNGVRRWQSLDNGRAPDFPGSSGRSRIAPRARGEISPIGPSMILKSWMDMKVEAERAARPEERFSACSGCCPHLRVKPPSADPSTPAGDDPSARFARSGSTLARDDTGFAALAWDDGVSAERPRSAGASRGRFQLTNSPP